MEQKSKIDGLEATFMIMVCLFFDGIDVVATLLDVALGAGEIIKWFNDVIASSILYFWVTMSDVSPLWTLVGAALELIPVGNTLPIRTITMGITIYIDRHPEKLESAETAYRVISKKVNVAAPRVAQATTVTSAGATPQTVRKTVLLGSATQTTASAGGTAKKVTQAAKVVSKI